ncbi:MAG: BtrH N-terminal domain-containing protein [Syntrophaceae bacterium]|nr:BtrH N-terminal domain-containing protein [Syntrophaceae bacterium]
MKHVIDFEHRHYGHCESGVVSGLLRHSGLDLSEAMVFGLASAIMFAYIPFLRMNNMPTISYRILPRTIISGIQSRLGVPFRKRTYRDPRRAMEELVDFMRRGQIVGLQTSAYWLTYFPPEMRFQFNVHNLIVFGVEDGEFLVSDPVFEHPVRIPAADLENARFARGVMAPKGFVYHPEGVPSSVDLPVLIRKAIARTLFMMLSSPPPFGIRGIFYLARKIERMERSKDGRYIRLFLGHMVRMQEEIGTGGGGFRFMYAAFLQEAADILHSALLGEASWKMTEAGDQWRTFALACARIIRQRDGAPDLKEIAALLRRCGEVERDVYVLLKKGI